MEEDKIPIIVRSCIEWLERKGLKEPGLFRESASASQLSDLKGKFDKGEEVNLATVMDPHLIAGLLKLHFRDLDEPIFPSYKGLMEANAIEDMNARIGKIRDTVQSLPSANLQVVTFLFGFLKLVVEYNDKNLMTSDNLAVCWAPTLFRSGAGGTQAIVIYLIEKYDVIFSQSSIPTTTTVKSSNTPTSSPIPQKKAMTKGAILLPVVPNLIGGKDSPGLKSMSRSNEWETKKTKRKKLLNI